MLLIHQDTVNDDGNYDEKEENYENKYGCLFMFFVFQLSGVIKLEKRS